MIEKNKEEKYYVALGSLLHDIGKFKYRVIYNKDTKNKDTHDNLNSKILQEIFEKNFDYDKLNELLKDKTNHLTKCVWLGDYISSQERDLLEEYQEENEKKLIKNRNILQEPLKNIFSRVKILEKNSSEISYILDQKLNFNNFDNLVFKNKEEFKNFKKENYKEFIDEFKKITKEEKDIEILYFKILKLMEKYLVNIPSSAYVDVGDVDLYNHSKLSSAISTCLYDLLENNKLTEKEIANIYKENTDFYLNKIKNAKNTDEIKEEIKKLDSTSLLKKELFLKVKFDFSGIQDFIFNISSKKALKLLKSRSFSISFLSYLFAYYYIEKFDLNPSNIIYISGGNFELLIPYKKENINILIEEGNKINNIFFEKYDKSLFLSINYNPLSIVDFSIYAEKTDENNNNNLVELFSKNKKFENLIKEKKESFFLDENIYLNECSSCHNSIKEELNEDNFCELCSNLESLYTEIKKIEKYKILNPNTIQKISKRLYFEEFTSKFFGKKLNFNINSFENDGLFEILSLGIIGINEDNNNKIELNKVADEAYERTGLRKIGAFKLDVDNLGDIFINGFGDIRSFSRYSVLSYRLKLFFEGYVSYLQNTGYFNDINNSKIKYSETIDIIYSGGDDTLVVGAWDSVLYFLRDLKNAFTDYTKNKGFHFSASYGVYGGKEPIYNIVNDLEEKLDYIKGIDKNKNKSYIINDYVNNDNFEDVLNISKIIYNIVKENKKRSFILRFFNTCENLEKLFNSKENNFNISAYWRLIYYLGREFKIESTNPINFKDENLNKLYHLFNKEIEKFLKKEIDNFNIKKYKIAAKIAELETKKI